MMIEQHYDEEVLAEFLAEPQDSVARDTHLASCGLCLRTLDSLRSTATVLRHRAVWDTTAVSTEPRADTLAFLRNVQKTMLNEDAAAAMAIKQLLAGSRESWAPRLEAHPEWRTGGMVRGLLAEAEKATQVVPADAVEIAAISVNIAGALETANARHLQGLTHSCHAYALWYVGEIREALAELDRADERLSTVYVAELDRARVSVVRSMIYDTIERRDEALSLANSAAVVFDRYRDADRFAAARATAAVALQSARRLREAVKIHSEIAESADVSAQWRLSALHNMALCYCELADFDLAVNCLLRAIAGYERLNMLTFRSRSRWALADILARKGDYARAIPAYNELRQEYEELGMTNDLAMVSVDLAEALLVSGRAGEIRQVCAASMAYFAKAGLAETEPALRAVAYLHEAAADEKLNPAAIRGIRAFLPEPTSKPTQLFLDSLQ